jgi:hypothetical protein
MKRSLRLPELGKCKYTSYFLSRKLHKFREQAIANTDASQYQQQLAARELVIREKVARELVIREKVARELVIREKVCYRRC